MFEKTSLDQLLNRSLEDSPSTGSRDQLSLFE